MEQEEILGWYTCCNVFIVTIWLFIPSAGWQYELGRCSSVAQYLHCYISQHLNSQYVSLADGWPVFVLLITKLGLADSKNQVYHFLGLWLQVTGGQSSRERLWKKDKWRALGFILVKDCINFSVILLANTAIMFVRQYLYLTNQTVYTPRKRWHLKLESLFRSIRCVCM